MRRSDQCLAEQAPFAVLPVIMPRVMIVSNVLLYREGLSASFARDGRLNVVAAVGETEAASSLFAHTVDAILIDASTPPALEVVRRIRADYPRLLIVGFGISGGTSNVVACAESGLAAFVDREGTLDELVGAVQAAMRGELACSPRVAAMLCDRLACLAGAPKMFNKLLTCRESEVAKLIALGLSNKEIAKDLSIGPATVKNHVHKILDKLKVRRRSAIAGCYRTDGDIYVGNRTTRQD